MSWADQRARLLNEDRPPSPGATEDPRRPFLRVQDLLAVVQVLDHGGDGTIEYVDWLHPVPDPDHKTRVLYLTRTRRILTSQQATELREAVREMPWRVRVTVHRAGAGWLAVTDPTTGEVHEIQMEDAPHAWLKAAGA